MQDSLLWKIKHKDHVKASYLFGTIHAYDPAIIHLPPALFDIIRECDRMAFELDLNHFNYSEVAKRMFIDDENISLKDLISETFYSKLIENGNEDEIRRCKPLYIANYIFKGNIRQSVEDKLLEFSNANNMAVCGLETVNEQLDVLDAVPLNVQAEILENSLADCVDPEEELEAMMTAYASQNFAAMKERAKITDKYPEFITGIHADRNLCMCNRLENLIQNQAVFIAIGALHLVDLSERKGLLTLLREKDCELLPVSINLMPN